MKYYALQVKTKAENQYIQKVYTRLNEEKARCIETNVLSTNNLDNAISKDKFDVRLYFFERRLPVRKSGKVTMQLAPLFAGYIFLEVQDLSIELKEIMKKTKGFYKFLWSTAEPTELKGRDLEIVKHFISFGTIAEPSKVDFDQNDRIIVKAGPLSGLEGSIIKVDKRKHRAKVQLNMYSNTFLIDFAFDVIDKNDAKKEVS